MPQAPITYPPVSGLIARYAGSPIVGSPTTRYYWVQVVYNDGTSPLSSVLINGPASLNNDNKITLNWNPMPSAISYNIYYTTSSTAPSAGAILLALGVSAPSFTDNGISNSPVTSVVKSAGLKEAYMRWDFAVDGGAQTTISPATADSIPAGALIVLGSIFVATACSGASSTYAIGVSGGSTTSILGATAVGSMTLNALFAGACNATPVRVATAGQLTITIGAAVSTGGAVEVHVFYIVPSRL